MEGSCSKIANHRAHVYHKATGYIFASLRSLDEHGMALRIKNKIEVGVPRIISMNLTYPERGASFVTTPDALNLLWKYSDAL